MTTSSLFSLKKEVIKITQPFVPSSLKPLGSQAIDATVDNIFSFVFRDPTTGHIMTSFYIEWKPTAPFSTTLSSSTIIGATSILVADASSLEKNYTITIGTGVTQETKVISAKSTNTLTIPALTYAHSSGELITLIASTTGWVTSSNQYYTFLANIFLNNKNLAWRIKYKDSTSPTPIESLFSDWCLFKTSSRPVCAITFPILDGDLISNEIPTFTHSFSDDNGKSQINYQYKVYDDSDIILWTSDLKTDYDNLLVPPKGLLLNNNYYKVEVTVTNSDKLSTISTKRRFFTNYSTANPNRIDYFTANPISDKANIDLKWQNIKHIIANYKGSGVRYKPAKFSNGVEVSQSVEKIYWDINIPEIFTLKGNFTPNSTTIGDIIYLHKDDSNYLRFNYDEVTNKFYVEKSVNGNIRTYGSPATIVTAGQSFSFTIKQTFTGLYIYTLVSGSLNEWGDI